MSHMKQSSLSLGKSAEPAIDDRLIESADQKSEREQQFKRENAEAFASMNTWVEEHGLPLETYRPF